MIIIIIIHRIITGIGTGQGLWVSSGLAWADVAWRVIKDGPSSDIPDIPVIPEIPKLPELPEVPAILEILEIPAIPALPNRFRGRFLSFFEVASHE